MGSERIAAAIASADAAAQAAARPVVVRVPLGEGRTFSIEVPGDLQVVEVLAIVAWLAGGGLGVELAKASPGARLTI